MCLRQKCVSFLICLFVLPWLVLGAIAWTVQTVTNCNDWNPNCQSFFFIWHLPWLTRYTMDWWIHQPCHGGCHRLKAMQLVSKWPCTLDWYLHWAHCNSSMKSCHSQSTRSEPRSSATWWYRPSLIPRKGLIKAAGGPHAFSRHSAMVLIGHWLHQWFITTVWLQFSLRGPKERRREEKGGWEALGSVVKH